MNFPKTLSLLGLAVVLSNNIQAQTPGKIAQTQQVLLPNGWKLSPAGRNSLQLGDLPLNMQLSASGKLLAINNSGQSTQSVQLIDPVKELVLDTKIVGKTWYGIAFSRDEKKLYASGGNDNWILGLNITDDKKFGTADTIKLGLPWPKGKICPTGIAVDRKGEKLYTVTKEDNALYVIDLKNKSILKKLALGNEAYSCIFSPDEKLLYISLWGGDKIAIYDTGKESITGYMTTENHPNEILLNKKGTVLFAANANDNSVSVINTASKKVIEVFSTTLYPTKLTGSTTNGLALSTDEKTLYIANADNNCLAVFDVSSIGNSHSLGFIPVGWYPTGVKTLGSKILVANGKGYTSMANPKGPQPVIKDNSGYQKGATPKKDVQYIAGLFWGQLSVIDEPKPDLLKTYTAQVYANTPFTDKKEAQADGLAGNPIPTRAGEKSPIKHVFYIIKENRTYDQVLGDVKEGNGDSTLCIFGKKVTPNLHHVANQFVLLDNFYVDAEVSADGHNWSTAAYANDFVEKTWPTSYGSRGGNYDFEGTRKIAYPKKGFIWDYCQRAGLSYRTYGEFAEYGKTSLKSLKGHVCEQAPGFNLDITDQVREQVWEHDFDSLLTKNAVPQFNTIRISNDHTSGQKKGKIAPDAAVADNDLAVGKLIEHLSKSPLWKESVVIVLEDDAQNGPDHIDAHRSPVFLAGGYVKRNAVIHQMYSTSGVLRTIELILGLPPMSQYDAAAVPLFECFSNTPDLTPFESKANIIDLEKRNIAVNQSSKRSDLFNFAKEDSAPDLDLNDVIWKYMKGENSVMPSPKRSAFVLLEKKKKDDDD